MNMDLTRLNNKTSDNLPKNSFCLYLESAF
jgi:hypothetical protein